ncbi:alpha/beta hydrolase fold family protein [Lyngbya aestuarii BL J]|uniref:Alpha/beta hydrolase fold family protein n=1 Tax=Lyngbya aestuarii BL J TaxID=1348334 RepID=U7QFK3_9CYAN|nr:alpha/beta hydrolase [Lyngbya aestuarii]ERT06729.1 alpha/beta hydrolase fold family protein [Lyngbya aestuarii BL J]
MLTEIEVHPFVEWGSGDKTLVFIHYFGGAAISWQWVAQQLPDFRCIAFNVPGFGGTSAPQKPTLQQYADTISQTLADLNLKNYSLIGHSMGGKLALQVAINCDFSPQQIILIAPSPPTQEPMPEAEKQRLLDHHPSTENAETTIKNATQKPLDEEQYAVAIQTHKIVEDAAWRWWLLEGMNHSIADQIVQLRIPVTVLASKDDPVIYYSLIQSDVIGLLPNAKLITIENVGHLIPLETAEWTATQLRQIILSDQE